jgi:murein DD-endopeptidase MepM/ murein hydrolase activator NlpD
LFAERLGGCFLISDIPQNTGTAPGKTEDRSPLVDVRESIPSETNRQSGSNKVALIGLALSVGTYGALFAPFAQSANAAETAAAAATLSSTPVTSAAAELVQTPDQPSVAVVAPTQAATTHKVILGETLNQIAANYGVDAGSLAGTNQLQPNAALKPGQVLQLPTPAASVTNLRQLTESTANVPVVASIQSAQNGTTSASTATVSPAEPKDTIALLKEKRNQLQQSLAGLGEESLSASPVEIKTYQVNPGDTLAAIARSQNVSYGELLRLNQLTDPNQIQPYQQLRLPTAVVTAAPVAVAAETPGSLPVTSLAKTPLPAIGGEVPEVLVGQTRVGQTSDAAIAAPTVTASATQFDASPLLAEINSLRDRYRQQNSPYSAPAAVKVAAKPNDAIVPVVQAPVAARVEAAPAVKQVASIANPDFAQRRSDSALSIELRNFVQPKLKPESGIEKVSASLPITNAPAVTRSNRPAIVARATVGADSYAPVAPSVARMVAPNMPGLGDGDVFLPGSMGNSATAGMIWPSKGMLSSGYGPRWGRMHRGIDIAAPVGTPIVAVAAGTVSYSGWNDGGYGYLVEIEHADGTMTRYGHNSRLLVAKGQPVAQGQQVSEMGSTGFSTGPHLHFEVHPRGQGAVNPMAFLSGQS